MPVRKSPIWMQQLDERILEFLRNESPTLSSVMVENEWIRASEPEVLYRCGLLYRADLIEMDDQWFKITARGIQYLDGRDSPNPIDKGYTSEIAKLTITNYIENTGTDGIRIHRQTVGES